MTLAQEEGSEWELDTAELEELVDEVCGDAESTDEYLECACEVAGGCTDDEGSDDDDLSLTPSEEAEAEAFEGAIAEACGEPVDDEDEEWGECFCDFIGGCTELVGDEE